MQVSYTQRRLWFIGLCVCVVAFVAEGRPVVPTLARLSFWVPEARMAEFESGDAEKIVPILKTHGLMESSKRGRTTVERTFSRLFAVKTLAEVAGDIT